MNTATSRLFWKELRTQSHIWFALLGMIAVLQCLPIFIERGRFSEEVVAYIFSVGIVVTACFAATSAAIAFAGEEESGTSNWLRTLPIRTLNLFIAKFGFVLCGTVALLLSSLLVGALIVRIHSAELDLISATALMDQSWMIVEIALWGFVFSLVLRSVMHAILFAVLADILVVALASPWQFHIGMIRGVVAGVLAVCVIWLFRKWHLQPAWRLSPPFFIRRTPREHEGFSRANSSVSRGSPTSGAASATADLSLTNRGWLAWAATQNTPVKRHWMVLIWKELRLIRYACIAFLVAVVIGHVRNPLEIPAYLLLMFMIPLLSGLMVFRQDINVRAFYDNRGLSPLPFWFVKTTLWLSVACLFCCALASWGPPAGDRAGNLQSLLRQVYGTRRIENGEFATVQFQAEILLLTGLFAIGQIFSYGCSRIVIGLPFAFVCGSLYFVAVLLWISADVPLTWTALPMTICYFLSTLATSRYWLPEKRSWHLSLVLVFWLMVPACGAFAVGQAFRLYQIPQISMANTLLEQSAQLTEQGRQWATAMKTAEMGEVEQASGRISQLVQEIDENMSIPLLDSNILSSTLSTTSNARLIDSGLRHFKANDLNLSYRRFVDSLRLSRFRQRESASWTDLYHHLLSEDLALACLRSWASHPDVTMQQLDTALEELKAELQSPVGAMPMLKKRCLYYHQAYTLTGPVGNFIQHDLDDSSEFAFYRGRMGSIERRRALRILNQITSAALNDPVLVRSEYVPEASNLLREVFSRYVNTTSAAFALQVDPMLYSGFDRYYQLPWMRTLIDNTALERGTILAIATQRYRREHNDWPTTLYQLQGVEDFTEDPWTHVNFMYRPAGFPEETPLSRQLSLRAHVPVIYGRSLVYVEDPAQSHRNFLSDFEVPSPDGALELRFVVLGHDFQDMSLYSPRDESTDSGGGGSMGGDAMEKSAFDEYDPEAGATGEAATEAGTPELNPFSSMSSQ